MSVWFLTNEDKLEIDAKIEALKKIANSMYEKLEFSNIDSGWYVGTGNSGNYNDSKTLSFRGKPQLVIIHAGRESAQGANTKAKDSGIGVFINGAPYGTIVECYGTGGETTSAENQALFTQVELTWRENSVTWYSGTRRPLNMEYRYYYYAAFI